MVVTNGHIFKAGAQQEKGETARMSSFVGAIAIGDMVKTTLGPKGMDKVLQSSDNNAKELQVTNDGATILKSIGIDNPIAKILVDISKVQDDEVGDGTTSVAVIASELLRTAEQLILRRIHPQIIISGWRKAHAISMKVIDNIAIDTSADSEKFHSDLINVACTTLSSKVLYSCKRHFAELCVKAALRIRNHSDLRAVQIIKVNGKSLEDSYLEDGFILQKKVGMNQPQRIENAKILIANTPMDTDKIKIFGSRTRVDSVAKIAEVEKAERNKMKEKVEKIASSGCTVFINRQLIYNYPEQLFADAGIMAIEHADFEGIERLALVLNGEIASSFQTVDDVKLGRCKCIEQIMIGEEQMLRFSGVALGEACTLVIRGSTQQMLDEAERSVHDALCILCQMLRKDPRIVYGGGCTEMRIYKAIDDEALCTPGKESIAMMSFANALRQIPIIIADNGGYDSEELATQLMSAISNGHLTAGLDMNNGRVGDMAELGITESYMLKKQVITSGTEAAEMILRVDEIIKQAPRKRVPDTRPH